MHRIHEISNVPEAKHAHGHIRSAQKKPIARNRVYRTRLAASFANFPLSSHSYLINYFSNDSAASDNNKYTRTEISLVALPLAKLHKQCTKTYLFIFRVITTTDKHSPIYKQTSIRTQKITYSQQRLIISYDCV